MRLETEDLSQFLNIVNERQLYICEDFCLSFGISRTDACVVKTGNSAVHSIIRLWGFYFGKLCPS